MNILGEEYKIEYREVADDDKLKSYEAYTNFCSKTIVMSKRDREDYMTNKVLRHEIIHAFLFESGLDCNSYDSISWAENEEMVDWFAIQSPKIFKIFEEYGIL